MQEGAGLVSAEGTILYCNRSLAQLLNTPLERLMGESIHAFIAPADAAGFRRMLDAGNHSGSAGESTLQARDGSRVPVHLSLKLMQMDGVQVFSLIATDLTERKQAEETLQRAHDELEDRVEERTAELEHSNTRLQNEIEERKRVEEELQSIARFPAENPNPTLRLDNGRTIIYANSAARATFAEAFAGPGTDAPEDIAAIAETVLASGVRQEVEHRIGAETYLLTFVPFRDRHYVNVYGRNITERKRAEEALGESETRERRRASELQTVMEAVPAGIFIAPDPEGRTIYGNHAAYDQMRMPPGSNLSRSAPDGERPLHFRVMKDGVEIPPEELPVQKAAATGRPVDRAEFDLVFDDGTVRQLLGNAVPLPDENGGTRGAVGIFLDISDRKRMEEALRQSERSLATELDAARRLQQVSTQMIQADRVEALYEEILDTAVTILDADFASIQMLYPERGTAGELRLLGHRGFTEEAARFWEWVRPDSESSCGKALLTGQRVIIPDVLHAEFQAGSADREVFLQTGIRAVQTTPLYSRSGTLLGMLSTHWRRPHEPAANELRFIDLLARQAADFIDRKRAEEALRRSEERFRLLTENASDIVVVLDAGGNISYASPSVRQVGGYAPEELIGRNAIELTHPDDLPLVANALSTVAAHPEDRVTLEVRFRHSSGEWLNFDVIGINLLKEPAVRGFVANARNITERRRAEDALRESEEKFRALVEHSLDGTLILDLEGTILFANHAAGRLAEIENPDELIGRNVMEFIDPASLDDALRDFEQVAKGIDAYVARYKVLTVTQEARWIESVGKTILFGGAPSILISLRDVTERQRAEEALRESKEKYRTLFDNAGDAIVIHDLEGRFLDVNRVATERFGYSREELLGRDLAMLTPPEFSALAPERIREVIRNGHMVFETADITREGRRIPTEISARLITYQGRPAILSTARDITERKRAKEALERRTEDLVRQSREVEAARDEAHMYLDIMTHDVRNANNVSGMYAGLLTELADEGLKTYTEKLQASIERSNEILRNVATVRRIHEDENGLVPINLDAVIQNEIGRFPEASIDYLDPQIEVLADGLLPTVFINLIGNAVKFGGPDVKIAIRAEVQGAEVLVSVEDTGPGIPDEVKKKLFRRFERGMGRGSGEGLGLFIVRTLVERYGGKIRVEDRVPGATDAGAAFRFTLRTAT